MASKEKELSKGSKNDAELLALMAQRLGMVENELLRTKREIIEKVRFLGCKLGGGLTSFYRMSISVGWSQESPCLKLRNV